MCCTAGASCLYCWFSLELPPSSSPLPSLPLRWWGVGRGVHVCEARGVWGPPLNCCLCCFLTFPSEVYITLSQAVPQPALKPDTMSLCCGGGPPPPHRWETCPLCGRKMIGCLSHTHTHTLPLALSLSRSLVCSQPVSGLICLSVLEACQNVIWLESDSM